MAQQTVRRVGPLRAPSASRPAAAARLAPPKAAAFGAGRAMGGASPRRRGALRRAADEPAAMGARAQTWGPCAPWAVPARPRGPRIGAPRVNEVAAGRGAHRKPCRGRRGHRGRSPRALAASRGTFVSSWRQGGARGRARAVHRACRRAAAPQRGEPKTWRRARAHAACLPRWGAAAGPVRGGVA